MRAMGPFMDPARQRLPHVLNVQMTLSGGAVWDDVFISPEHVSMC